MLNRLDLTSLEKMTSCPVCDSLQSEIVYVETLPLSTWTKGGTETGDINIALCRSCGHMWNTQFKESNASLIYKNQPLSNKPVSRGAMIRYEKVLDFIGVENISNKEIIEIGPGSGEFAAKLSEVGRHVLLFEPNENFKVDLKNTTTINDFFEPKAKADVVIARQVLEHAPDPVRFIRAVSESLRPGGLAYIEVPNGSEVALRGLWHDIHHPHVHYFNLSSLIKLCDRFGLKVQKFKNILDNHDFGILLGNYGGVNIDLKYLDPEIIRENFSDSRKAFLEFSGQGQFALYGATAVAVPLATVGFEPEIVYDDNPELWDWKIPLIKKPAISITKPSKLFLDRIVVASYLHFDKILNNIYKTGFSGDIFNPRSCSVVRL